MAKKVQVVATGTGFDNLIIRNEGDVFDVPESTAKKWSSWFKPVDPPAEAKAYLESLPPPFFRALTHYASDGSYSWHCPGHSGGVAFLKSPVGQMFHQFFR